MMQNSGDTGQLDAFDLRIIEALRADGRLPVTALADQVGLSKTPCQNRLRRLVEQGYITGFTASVDHARLNRAHVAFVEIKLSNTSEEALSAFNTAVRQVPEIEQCHMIAGSFDFLLKVRTQSITAYRKVLGSAVSTLPFVASTSTHVSMEMVKE